ncbi:hypothetical protein HXX76_000234 [Chlamydomonas incerta]|uniref:Uncharacterized protein n=1 Tax=Chlamydomonas incerta TaxID=51695 RepID=A0A835WE58_CHLIN|nr:hypothetical protein HXX76_000234 [Chlamydomonas incerta]|eukprot:KAG2445624.1 hypothetical protein HXX76_000234 [Chlamydomonas incerta]
MAPKKKGGGKKKKKDDGAEPPHDGSWERAVESGTWDKAVTDLPDANTWPTWGALRERVLTACREIKINNTASLRDAFANELVKLSPPELTLIDLRGSSNLHNFNLSPMTTCPKLTDLDLSECAGLDYVLLQSQTVRSVNLRKNPAMTKALIHCPRLNKLSITDCPALETLMLWTDELTELDLTGCNNLSVVKLQCPNLLDSKIPPLKVAPQHVKPSHPPIASLLKENLTTAAHKAAADKEALSGVKDTSDSIIPHVFRPF